MPIKPKTGERVSWREFFRQWKKGMRDITPLQQTIATQFGQFVVLIGLVWGVIFAIQLKYWWMVVVLGGGIIVLAVQMLGNWQRKIVLKEIEKAIAPLQESQLLATMKGGKH